MQPVDVRVATPTRRVGAHNLARHRRVGCQHVVHDPLVHGEAREARPLILGAPFSAVPAVQREERVAQRLAHQPLVRRAGASGGASHNLATFAALTGAFGAAHATRAAGAAVAARTHAARGAFERVRLARATWAEGDQRTAVPLERALDERHHERLVHGRLRHQGIEGEAAVEPAPRAIDGARRVAELDGIGYIQLRHREVEDALPYLFGQHAQARHATCTQPPMPSREHRPPQRQG